MLDQKIWHFIQEGLLDQEEGERLAGMLHPFLANLRRISRSEEGLGGIVHSILERLSQRPRPGGDTDRLEEILDSFVGEDAGIEIVARYAIQLDPSYSTELPDRQGLEEAAEKDWTQIEGILSNGILPKASPFLGNGSDHLHLSKPDGLWSFLMDYERAREGVQQVMEESQLEAAEALAEARRDRFHAASRRLAFAWMDTLLLVPEEDREAWIEGLDSWARTPDFSSALERDCRFFLASLPSLSLPDVNRDLIRTSTQDALWTLIRTGRPGEIEDDEVRYSLMDKARLDRELEDLQSQRADNRIDSDEFRMKRRLIEQVQSELENIQWGGRWGMRRPDEELERKKVLTEMAALYLDRHGEALELSDDSSRTRIRVASRGAVRRWAMEPEEQAFGPRLDMFGDPIGPQDPVTGTGVWKLDLDSLVGNGIYQVALRDVLSVKEVERWARQKRRSREDRLGAVQTYATALMDHRLHLSPSQRARAMKVAMMPTSSRDLESSNRFPPHIAHMVDGEGLEALLKVPDETVEDLTLRIARELDKGYLTPWQRERVQRILSETEWE